MGIECWPSMYKVLGSIPRTIKWKKGTGELGKEGVEKEHN